jgi:isovaleryl-CoA dehydrogenase
MMLASVAFRSSKRALSRSFASNLDIFNPTDEHLMLRETVRTFTETEVDPQALEYNRNEKFNRELFNKCGELGLLGVTVDPEYGGSGMDATAAVIIHEELSSADPAFCLSYLAHSMLFVNNVNQNASPEQKAQFLPDACSGAAICGMGMSEPDAGTDVLGMRTTAVRDGDNYILNGGKMWITNGTSDGTSTGDAFLIYARTGEGRADISSFLVRKGFPGFTLGQVIKDKCGMRASNTAELIFENVSVPATLLVGQENGASICMMRNLEIERVTLAAMSLGIARRSVQRMIDYSAERTAFGQPINQFGQIQKQIADSYAEYMAGRSYVYNVARELDLSTYGNGLDADGVKLFAGNMAKQIADRAIQIMGGNGYIGDYQVERLWRDAKLLEIGGGTNEAHHKNMVRDLKKMGTLK